VTDLTREIRACYSLIGSERRLVAWLIGLTGHRTRLLGKSGGSSVGKGGESDVKSRHLYGCNPHLCQLRTEGLVPTSKY
jgi:hypothetical protein